MAVSFSRPDPSSPASVADAGFSTGRRGFDQHEVRDFLRMVAAELGRLQERERFLERELRSAQSNPDLSSVQLDEQDLTRLLGEETARVLTTARESAAEIRQKAEQSAAQLLSEAADEASRLREEAEIEASRRRSDAAADAEAEVSMAKQQGREMVNEARAYRERVLSELARRRELAREQIEQLLHGRDRLMESFERARLVAVDVVSELQPLGEPDEYVNLAPTTGPVPVMVPNSARPVEQRAAVEEPAADMTVVDDDAVDEQAVGAPTDEVDDDTAAADDATDVVDADDVVDTTSDLVDVDTGETVDVDTTNDAAEVDAEETVDVEPEPDATIVGAADDDATAEVDRSGEATPAVDGDESDIDPGTTDATVDAVEGDDDDVVVDLFARLRNETQIETDAAERDADTPADDSEFGAGDQQAASDDSADADDADDEPTAFETRDAELTPLIVAGARKLKRVLADEQNDVLDTLRQREPVVESTAILPDVDVHVARFAEAIADELLAAAEAGARSAGRTRALRKADAAAAIDAASAVLAEWLVVPLRDRLGRCVADGAGDNADITRRIRSVYREWKTQHIDEQLDDVVRWAHGGGAAAGFEPDIVVEWVSDPAVAACADCNDNTLAGAVPIGTEFPTGHLRAPAHVGCRCLLLPADR